MFVDLSVAINEQTPVYPGDPAVQIKPAGILDQDGFNDHLVSIGTHAGTHIDAPMHMIADGQSLGSFGVDRFIGRGRLIEGFELAGVQAAGIEAGDIVLFRTNMSRQYYDTAYFENYPAMSTEVADYLIQAGAKMVGVDTCSVDNEDDFSIHKALLGAEVLIIENLTNLEHITADFTVYALPLKLDIDGAPTRVIAQLA